MKRNWKEKVKAFWKGWGVSFIIAIGIATSFKSAIADWNIVPTGSMKPTIVEGDRIFVNKLAYDLKIPYTTYHLAEWDNPRRGDIVVFYSPADGERLVKRVVGVPGDSLAMRNNQVIINGQKIEYQKISSLQRPGGLMDNGLRGYHFLENLGDRVHPVMITPGKHALRSFGPLTIPAGKYFMMGDNRDNSADSRFFGFVERDRIVGEATAIVISLNINDKYKPRWQRFFTALP